MTHGVSQEELNTPCGQVALKFSIALLNKSFDEAHSLLGSAICDEWPPHFLQQTYEEMVEYFEVISISVDSVEVDLPKPDADNAMVYVSIVGEGDVEAVTVIVENENGNHVIQDIEWGRP